MPSFDVTIQGKTYHVEIPDPGASPLQVVVDGEPFQVEVAGSEVAALPRPAAEPVRPAPQPSPLPALAPAPIVQPTAPIKLQGGYDIICPMPGTILSVEVSAGQTVEIGQVTCVLEAMKMKNPIRAIGAGTVAEVFVAPGQNVAYGDVLLRVA